MRFVGSRLPLALALAWCGACSAASSTATQEEEVAAGPVAKADAQSLLMVERANAFLATLSAAQREQVLYRWSDDRQRRNWSNLPEGSVRHGGLAWGDLDARQRAALAGLFEAVMSPRGVQMIRDQMDADELLFARLPRSSYGARNYFVSFLGAPSATAPWMFQFGGHHLAINATIVGPHLAMSPMLSGGHPLTLGARRRIEAADSEIAAAHDFIASLDPAQRATAIVSNRPMQMQAGPGRDGRLLAGQGIAGSALTAAQKARLLAVIEARLGVVNADDLAPLMAGIEQGLDRTVFGWWGPVSRGRPAYWRIVGPTLLLEYSFADSAGEHAHNIYRNPANEYGAAWAAIP